MGKNNGIFTFPAKTGCLLKYFESKEWRCVGRRKKIFKLSCERMWQTYKYTYFTFFHYNEIQSMTVINLNTVCQRLIIISDMQSKFWITPKSETSYERMTMTDFFYFTFHINEWQIFFSLLTYNIIPNSRVWLFRQYIYVYGTYMGHRKDIRRSLSSEPSIVYMCF